jgi:ketosteroid isomerase-like protein
MPEHANAIRIRELFDAFRAGDVAAIDVAIAADAVWRFPGRHGKLAGEHRGKDQIFSFLMNAQALTGGTFHVDLADVTASDEHAVAIFRGRGDRAGRRLDNPTALVIRFVDGKIVELREFVWDLEHVEEFWK